MKINLDEDDIIAISFCIGYSMGKAPLNKEKLVEVMKKITEPIIKKTRKEVKKVLE